MTTLTLLTKASHPSQLKRIENSLVAAFEGLDVKVEILGSSVNGWVQVSVSGEDEAIAKSYITKEIGVCPTSIDNVKEAPELKGYIIKLGKNQEALSVDVGVFEPKIILATIPLASLQTELVNGGKIALKKIAELYGFSDGLPVNIKVTNLNGAEGNMQAELSSAQIEKFKSWRESFLDRLIILGSTLGDVEKTLERTRLNRDVIGVESLGLFEHVLTCKLGTDATGLISKIGRYTRNSKLIVFNPKKIISFLGE